MNDRVNEGALGDFGSSLINSLFGDNTVSSWKGMISGKGAKHQLIQDLFLKDFMQDAITSLDNGVRGGFINTKKKSQVVDSEEYAIESVVSSLVLNSVPLSEAHVSKLYSLVEKDKLSRMGYVVEKKNDGFRLIENKHTKFRNLIESLIEDATGKLTISEFLNEWFTKYMQGVNWKSKSDYVHALILEIEKSYPNIKQPLLKLAQTAFAISKSSPNAPIGMKDEIQKINKDAEESKPKPTSNIVTESRQTSLVAGHK